MDDLIKEMDDTNSDTSIVDLNFASDDEEIIDQKVQPILETQDIVEIFAQEKQQVQKKAQIDLSQENHNEFNNIEKQEEENVISLPVQQIQLKPKQVKRKQPRECNLQQGYQILKILGNYTLLSYKNVQQKKDQALLKMTNFIISQVQKMKR
ncbi:unnamed protein product [Paramecium sonneborni]|uniref:Uncharacterized protein n=1 Tax=Paramecium sonneborni TaxID=65129 RepID=A0A8S1KX90_9CILI|nr:unnamed protein product [Paramecium sonneborni]